MPVLLGIICLSPMHKSNVETLYIISVKDTVGLFLFVYCYVIIITYSSVDDVYCIFYSVLNNMCGFKSHLLHLHVTVAMRSRDTWLRRTDRIWLPSNSDRQRDRYLFMAEFNFNNTYKTENREGCPTYKTPKKEQLMTVVPTMFGVPKHYGSVDGDIFVQTIDEYEMK